MKIKGISPFERHAEKIVLGVFVLFLFAVLLMQTGLIGGSPKVKVGASEVPLDKALAGVRDEAVKRRARLESAEVAPGVPGTLQNPLEAFEGTLAALPAPSVLASLGRPGIIGETSLSNVRPIDLPTGDSSFAAVAVGAPSVPVTTVFEGTIDPMAVDQIGAPLASLLPAQQPFDLRAVAVQSVFDAEAFRNGLTTPMQGSQPLPESFWQNRVEIVDVEWVRQERPPGGEWSAEQVVAVMPARQSLREVIQKADFQPGDFRDLAEGERLARLDIRRPPFYPVIAGRPWVWPEQARKEAANAGDEQVASLRRELSGLRAELKQTQDRLDNLNKPPEKTPPPAPPGRNPPQTPPGRTPPSTPPDKNPPPKNPGGGGRGDRAPSFPAGDQASNQGAGDEFVWPRIDPRWLAQGTPPREERSPDDRKREQQDREKKSLQDRIAAFKTGETALLQQLQKLGVDEKGAALAAAEFTEPLFSLSQKDLKAVTLWTTDLTARPGSSYRYKSRIIVTNPFYGQADKLKEDQKSLAQAPVVTGAFSDWSEPIAVEPGTVYFVTSATEAGGPLGADARANAELYQFFYGYWRRGSVAMSPGDPLIAAAALPELTTFTLGRGVNNTITVSDRPALPRERPIVADAFLLGTATVMGRGNEGQAYLRDGAGAVTVMAASSQGDEAIRRGRLAASSTLGQSALVREPGTKPEGGGQPPPQAPPPEGGGDQDPGKMPPRGNPPPAVPSRKY